MNRRSFLGSLLAAPIAAVMSLKWKPDPLPGSIKGGHYEMHIWDDPIDNTAQAESISFDSVWKMIDHLKREGSL